MIRPAAAFLALLIAFPAFAGEATGVIAKIDEDSQTMALAGGQTFKLPGEFDYSVLQTGQKVTVVYDETGDGDIVTDIELND